jgi:nucleoside 2-deoxyribosyltransferase
MNRFNLSPGRTAALGFACLFALALLSIYLASTFFVDNQTPEQTCYKKCSSSGRFSRMVPEHPKEQTAGMRTAGPTRCECY